MKKPELNQPTTMDPHEKAQLRSAAFRATRILPGPVGELVSRELLSWEEFGYRVAGDGLIQRTVTFLLAARLPEEKL